MATLFITNGECTGLYRLDTSTHSGKFCPRLYYSYLCHWAGGALIYHFLNIADLAVKPPFVLGTTSAAGLLGCLWTWSGKSQEKVSYVTELVMAMILVVPMVSLLKPFYGANDLQSFNMLKVKEDTSSQFQMYHYIAAKGKVAYRNSDARPEIRSSLRTYPQVAHAMMATVGSPFVNLRQPASLLKWYYASFSWFYASIFCFLYAVAVTPLRGKKGNSRTLSEVIVGAVIIAFGSLGLFINLFIYGFVGQVASYAMLLCGLYVVSEYYSSYRRKTLSKDKLIGLMILFSLSVFGVAGTWYLLLPTIVPAVIFLGHHLYRHHRRFFIHLTLVTLPSALAIMYLAYVYLIMAPSGSGHLLTPGGVERLPHRLYWLAVPALVSGIFMFKNRSWPHVVMNGAVIIAGIGSYAIGWYMLMKIGHRDYYFYKSLYTILLLSLMVSLSSIIYVLNTSKKLDHIRSSTVSVLAVMTIVIIYSVHIQHTAKDVMVYQTDMTYLRNNTSPKPIDKLLDDDVYKKYGDLVFVGSCDRYLDFMGTIWAGSMFLDYGAERQAVEGAVLKGPATALNKKLIEYAGEFTKDKPLGIMVNGRCGSEITQQILETENDKGRALIIQQEEPNSR